MGVEGLDSVHQLQSVCKTHVVELNKLGRGQAEIQACGGTEFQRAPLVCSHRLIGTLRVSFEFWVAASGA